jgi:hypothetical protein
VATGVVSDAMGKVGAHVFNAEAVDEELAQFVNPGHERFKLLVEIFVTKLGNQSGVLIADHGDTGRGGDYDSLGILVEPDETLGLGEGLGAEAGVGVHLAATGLFGVKVQIHAQPFKQTDYGAASLRVEGVVVAGDEERSAHRVHLIFDNDDQKRYGIRYGYELSIASSGCNSLNENHD